jgi:mono/diheme cytochrome c family protein
MKSLSFAFAGLLVGVLSSPVSFAADASHGKVLAERWCAGCHLVGPEQRQANADVRSFVAIGRDPKFNANRLAFFLLDPHPKMPDMQLTRTEAQDLAAYVKSLR